MTPLDRVRQWARDLLAVAAWAQLNKLAIGGVTSGVLAVVRAVADGADTTTLVLAVASVAGVLSHLTVTPLARPRAADGTPLVPAATTVPLEVSVGETTSGFDLLPAVHDKGRRTGAQPRTTDDRDYQLDRLPQRTGSVRLAWTRVVSFPMLLNDRLGDCTIAGVLHLLQILVFIGTGRLVTFTDDDALTGYERICGYVLGRSSTDRGGNLRTVLLAVQKVGLAGWKIGEFALVDMTSLPAVRQACDQHGGVYAALDLPDDYERLGWHWVIRPNSPPDPEEGHCVVIVIDDQGRIWALTWGGKALVSQRFLTTYFDQGFAVDGATPALSTAA